MHDLLEQSLGPRITLHVEIAADAATVRSDANQLELALLNIALNARDAMPKGGDFHIRTRLAPARPRRGGRFVEIALSDTGVGMSKEVAQRALEPFFTTKGVDKGTGLGLAQVYAVARQTGGDVLVESAVGQGTTIRLELPAAEPPPPPAVAPPAPVSTSARVGRRILVIDDDEAVRAFIVESLRTRGCTVFEAGTGDAALVDLPKLDPALIVVDYLMPGLNGAEFAHRVREMRPHQKIMIVSGHMDSNALRKLAPDVPVLHKPFAGDELWAKVIELLEAA
jgi:CheY-like chemotaxis protein